MSRADLLARAPPARIQALFLHAPEVECIGKGKAAARYEFGVKASIVTTDARARGSQFVLHDKALPATHKHTRRHHRSDREAHSTPPARTRVKSFWANS